eukprot:8679245-Pyramimonas_sp.AAC.1
MPMPCPTIAEDRCGRICQLHIRHQLHEALRQHQHEEHRVEDAQRLAERNGQRGPEREHGRVVDAQRRPDDDQRRLVVEVPNGCAQQQTRAHARREIRTNNV